jgi:hypothetical protein
MDCPWSVPLRPVGFITVRNTTPPRESDATPANRTGCHQRLALRSANGSVASTFGDR